MNGLSVETPACLALARKPDSAARKNLRNVLWSIRDLLGPDVLAGHETLALSEGTQ